MDDVRVRGVGDTDVDTRASLSSSVIQPESEQVSISHRVCRVKHVVCCGFDI